MKPSPSPAAYPLPWRREANDTMARFLAADGTGIAIAEKASANDALWSFIVEALASRGTRALTEEERNYLIEMDARPTEYAATLKYDVLNLRRIISRLTGEPAKSPPQGDGTHG